MKPIQETAMVHPSDDRSAGMNISIQPAAPGVYSDDTYAPDAAKDTNTVIGQTPRLEFIDGLRAFAMLQVLLFHITAFSGPLRLDVPLGHHKFNLLAVLSVGHVGVSLFLVLSGFCLYWPFVKGGKRREMTLAEFAWKRCHRILPPYYIALLLFIGLNALQIVQGHTQEGWGQFGTSIGWHLVMLQNMRPQYFFDINGSFWSLALECHLYVIFPLLVEVSRRFGVRPMLLTVLAVSTVFRLLAISAGGEDNEWVNVLTYSVFGRFLEFALGMFAASIVAQPRGIRTLAWFDYAVGTAVVLATLAGHKFGLMEAGKAALSGIAFTALLLAASRTGSLLHRLLTYPLIIRLGVMSYSIYLIHQPLVLMLGAWTSVHIHGNIARMLFELFLITPLMLGLGTLFHVLFEKPFMRQPAKHRLVPIPATQ